MKLRTFDGEPVRGEITTDFPVSQDGIPILLADGEPFSPEEAEFFLESATPKEMKCWKKAVTISQHGKKRRRDTRKPKKLIRMRIENVGDGTFFLNRFDQYG